MKPSKLTWAQGGKKACRARGTTPRKQKVEGRGHHAYPER